jgi:hypothetical protein
MQLFDILNGIDLAKSCLTPSTGIACYNKKIILVVPCPPLYKNSHLIFLCLPSIEEIIFY